MLSYHPKHILHAIPTGENTRIERACTNESDLEFQLDEARERLIKRSYSKWSLDGASNIINKKKVFNKPC